MDPDVRRFILLFILILLSAFFSSAETALVSVNRIKIKTLADSGNKRAALVLKLNDNPGKLLSAVLIGNNIVNITASSLTTIIMQSQFDNIPLSIGTGILTFIIIVFSEIIPKTAAKVYSDRISLIYAPVIYFYSVIITPVIFIIEIFARIIMKLFGINPDKKEDPITEEEFMTVVDSTHESGAIEDKEKDIIENVLDFGDSVAKDIMVPRIDILFASDEDSYEEIADKFKQSNFSRIPVYHDTTDNVTGIIFLKDFFALNKEAANSFKADKIARKPYFTFENKKTAELLAELREAKISIAIVLDEYGTTAGLLTIEDLLEEIVGELRDEYDLDEEDEIKKINDITFIAEGTARTDTVNEMTGLSITEEDFESLAGYIIHLVERIPEKNEVIHDDNASYYILKASNNRIDKIKIILKKDKE